MTQRQSGSIGGLVLLGLLIAASGAWGTLALAFCIPGALPAAIASGAFAVALIAALVGLTLPRRRWQLFSVYAVLFIAVLLWWLALEPSNDRDWQTDDARLPDATIEGDQVTVHGIRNFDYRSETDYTPAYYDRRFDLAKLEAVDLIAVYWMGPAIAHTFISFQFAGDEHLAISIESRKKKGDAYSTLRGFFRQYELYYVVADERDVIRLRTNYRHDPPEEAYIYRIKGSAADGRQFFLQYMARVNSLKAKPEFYNTLTSNCTTGIWLNTLVTSNHVPLSWKVLVSGYVPQYLYDIGRLDTNLSFAALQQSAHVNERAHAADQAADFSQRIRTPAGKP